MTIGSSGLGQTLGDAIRQMMTPPQLEAEAARKKQRYWSGNGLRKLPEALEARLVSGNLVATGFIPGGRTPEPIHPEIFIGARARIASDGILSRLGVEYSMVRLQGTEPSEPVTLISPDLLEWFKQHLRQHPRPKREAALKACAKETGATYRQARDAWKVALAEEIKRVGGQAK